MKALGLRCSGGVSCKSAPQTSCSPAPALGSGQPAHAAPVWGPRQQHLFQPIRSRDGVLRAARRDDSRTHHRRTLLAVPAALLTAVPHQPAAPAVAAPPALTAAEPVQLNGSPNGSSSNGEEPPECARDCRPANPPLRITAPGRVVAGQLQSSKLPLAAQTAAQSLVPGCIARGVHEKSLWSHPAANRGCPCRALAAVPEITALQGDAKRRARACLQLHMLVWSIPPDACAHCCSGRHPWRPAEGNHAVQAGGLRGRGGQAPGVDRRQHHCRAARRCA